MTLQTASDLFSQSLITAAIVLTTATVSFLLLIKRKLEKQKPFPELPSPPSSHWLTGQLFNLMGDDFDKAQRFVMMDHSNSYGQTGYYIMNQKVVSAWHASDVRTILNSTADREMAPIVRYHFDKFVGSANLAVMNGRTWKLHRTLIQRSFSPSAVASYKADMVQVTKRLVAAVRSANETTTLDVDLSELCKCITVDVFMQTAFGMDGGNCRNLKLGKEAQAFTFLQEEAKRRLLGAMSPFNSLYWIPTIQNRRHAAADRTIRSSLRQIVEDRMKRTSIEQIKTKKDKDFLDLLLLDDTMKDERVLVDTLLSILFAGYDTTSVALVYSLYYMKQNATIQDRCLEEIHRVWDETDGRFPDVSKLSYVNAVLMEAIRLHAPATTTARTLPKDVQLSGGFVAPAGSYALIPLYHLHREEQNFHLATEFHPERWVVQNDKKTWVDRPVEDKSYKVKAAKRENMLAFSAGGRYCPGQRFALQEGALVLATLLRDLNYDIDSQYKLNPGETFIIQRPKLGMPAKIYTVDSSE